MTPEEKQEWDRSRVVWRNAVTRRPVGYPDLDRLQGAFERFNAKLPVGTREIRMNVFELEDLQARLINAGLHDAEGRPVWYSVPIEGDPDIPRGTLRFIR